jgi:uncharacterized protein (TIGR02594 family)
MEADMASTEIKSIQNALAQKGFDPGVIDGVWGRRTEAAVRAFQQKAGLQVDGVVGPATRAALLGAGAAPPRPLSDPALAWFIEAQRLLGVKENKAGDNDIILDWASDLGIPYKHDDIPWCGLFVAHCVGSTLTREPLPNNPLGARNWMRFGAPTTPKAGAIMVFWRVSRDGFKGHVGFYAGEDDGAFHILGGNQSDKVSVARIARDRLLGARWPATAPIATGSPVNFAANQTILDQLSTNEA